MKITIVLVFLLVSGGCIIYQLIKWSQRNKKEITIQEYLSEKKGKYRDLTENEAQFIQDVMRIYSFKIQKILRDNNIKDTRGNFLTDMEEGVLTINFTIVDKVEGTKYNFYFPDKFSITYKNKTHKFDNFSGDENYIKQTLTIAGILE